MAYVISNLNADPPSDFFILVHSRQYAADVQSSMLFIPARHEICLDDSRGLCT